MTAKKKAVYDHRVQCDVVRLSYDFPEHRGILYIPDGDATDQTGTVEMFKGLDPEVKTIQVVAGETLDIVYNYNAKTKEWEGFDARRGMKK